jgi:uncharacterized membrane protein YgdD (TMEM256/DUF423 family)
LFSGIASHAVSKYKLHEGHSAIRSLPIIKDQTPNPNLMFQTAKSFLILGSLLSALSVAIGAFGAHSLKELLERTDRIATFETAVQYQIFHSLAILIIGILLHTGIAPKVGLAGNLFFIGILIFSGSLYMLCLTGKTWLGAITPIGGTLFIVGWVLVAWQIWKA